MARTKKQRRESTAAYAASQPLFDALRKATIQIDAQKARLCKARDMVQQLHVKHQSIMDKDDAKNHKRYIAYVVKAWRDATRMYSEVFEELVQLTAENESEGRGVLEGHYGLVALLNGAYAAYKPTVNCSLEDDDTESLDLEIGDKRSAGPYPNRTKRSRMKSEENVQSPTFEQDKKPPAHRFTTTMQGKRAAPSADDHIQRAGNRPGHLPHVVHNFPEQENKHSEIQFEDILAEVEARLRAKEERKKAKKTERKRKRESLDSALEPPTPGTLSSEKPMKKKARSETASTPAVANSGVAEKRKSDANALDDAVRGHKKRKKHGYI